MIDYNCLAQTFDTTFGRASLGTKPWSVKFKLLDDKSIEVCYMTVVNMVSETQMYDLQKKYKTEASAIVNDSVKKVKENYKELSDKKLNFKQISDNDSFEIIDLNIYNGKRSAIYRRRVTFELS